MKIDTIYYSSHFARKFKKISSEEKLLLEKLEKTFRNNCFDPSLKTHKLTGKLKYYWSFSTSYKKRILFEFENDNVVTFLDIDDHDIYK